MSEATEGEGKPDDAEAPAAEAGGQTSDDAEAPAAEAGGQTSDVAEAAPDKGGVEAEVSQDDGKQATAEGDDLGTGAEQPPEAVPGPEQITEAVAGTEEAAGAVTATEEAPVDVPRTEEVPDQAGLPTGAGESQPDSGAAETEGLQPGISDSALEKAENIGYPSQDPSLTQGLQGLAKPEELAASLEQGNIDFFENMAPRGLESLLMLSAAEGGKKMPVTPAWRTKRVSHTRRSGEKVWKPDIRGKPGTAMPAEFIYKPAAAVIQNPVLQLSQRPCRRETTLGESVHYSRQKSTRTALEMHRKTLQHYQTLSGLTWEPNPTATVPMRVSRYKGKKNWAPPVPTNEWQLLEDRDKELRDHELAKELGYETLVGNIQNIEIPGARDIQRSWLNFLSNDVMEWGFPYEKGSIERPRMRQPEPYLAHQVREKLWRFPRAKLLQAMQEDSTVV